MGAAAGHISHLYENPEFSINDIFNIIQGITKGTIPSYEKVDGQNLMVSVKNGMIVAARNKSQLAQPVPLTYILDMFVKYPHVHDSFQDAINRISNSFRYIDINHLNSVFCNGSKFLNVEIVNEKSKNVISYNHPMVVMNSIATINTDGKFGNIINQNVLSAAEFHIRFESVFNSQCIYSPRLIDHRNFADFSIMPYKSLFFKYGITDFNKKLSQYSDISEVLKNIILKISNELILPISSKFGDPNIIKQTILTRIEDTLTANHSDQQIVNKIQNQLQRIKFCGGFSYLPSIEGVVFYYKNLPYKLTGLFAPINQLLGIMKYSR